MTQRNYAPHSIPTSHDYSYHVLSVTRTGDTCDTEFTTLRAAMLHFTSGKQSTSILSSSITRSDGKIIDQYNQQPE